MNITTCYRVWLIEGHPEREAVDFAPRFCDTVDAALERLRHAPALEPPIVRAGDYDELLRRWAAEGEARG